MRFIKPIAWFSSILLLTSCWKFSDRRNTSQPDRGSKVWGFKPVYGVENRAKEVLYSPTPQRVINGGNIYAFQQYLFQVESGAGIHVINNNNPATANRIGFITVKGCSQMSIKSNKLYTNSYDDLVVLDIADITNMRELSRLKGVFTEYRYGSPLAQPPTAGYYECPRHDSLVIGWVKDSVYQSCYKN